MSHITARLLWILIAWVQIYYSSHRFLKLIVKTERASETLSICLITFGDNDQLTY